MNLLSIPAVAVKQSLIKTLPSTLPTVETFHSIQGEGIWTGASAFFIRLAGCDVGCSWCDTKHSWPMQSHPQREIATLVEEALAAQPFMVVITGGEPLMHDLTHLSTALRQQGLRVHLETSGSSPLTGEFDWITLSPKRFKPPLEAIYSQIHELKIVVGDQADLDWAELALKKLAANATPKHNSDNESENNPKHSPKKLLQPQWSNEQGQKLVFDYVLTHPEWRVSLQTHKFLGIR